MVVASKGGSFQLRSCFGPCYTNALMTASHESWLRARIAEAQSIKPGMALAQLLEHFAEDGGMQPIPATRYVLSSCAMIKVDVELDAASRLRSISRPYLELPYMD
jgi:hypothetical protein